MQKLPLVVVALVLILQVACIEARVDQNVRRTDVAPTTARKRAAGAKRCIDDCNGPCDTGEGPSTMPFELSYPPEGNECLLCVANCGWVAGGGDPRNRIPGLDFGRAKCCLVGCVQEGKCESMCSMCRQICKNVALGVAKQAQCWQEQGCGLCPNPFNDGGTGGGIYDGGEALYFGNPPQPPQDGNGDYGQ